MMACQTKQISLLNIFGLLFILISIQTTQVEAIEQIKGYLQSCPNEGEEVQVASINSKCYKCICQNGFVQCDTEEQCPYTDDCYILERSPPGTCCKKCKECVYKGIRYQSGTEWTNPNNSCENFKCVSGVVTQTEVQCYAQCDPRTTIPARDGQCCPMCDGCTLNGQTIHEGREVSSIDDPCLTCKCSGRKLTCMKKACPVLQCPISRQIKRPGECCPSKCRETRNLLEVAGSCLLGQGFHPNKKSFNPDRCTNCTCENGTSVCRRATCPVLECPSEYQVHDEGCCPKCMLSEFKSECVYNGTTYQNNESWKIGSCRSCICQSGDIRCVQTKCEAAKCKHNEKLITPEGECCPKCIESVGTCTVFGDPHFKTFDGKFYSFQGSCKYQLAADCRDHTFSIRLTNEDRGTKLSSWTKTVTLKMKGVRVNLGQKLRVKVNGTKVILPYSNGPITSIERLPEGILLKTDLGIQIEWDGNNFLQVQVPVTYKRKLCGLCGNYNGLGRDDLTSRDGSSPPEVYRFANSWKVGGPKACSRKTEKIAAQPTCRQRKANFLCQPLEQSEIFGGCDSINNPRNYFESCKMDMCECPHGVCYCDSFAAYAHECQRLGVRLPDWREATNCPLGGYAMRNRTTNNNYMDNSLRPMYTSTQTHMHHKKQKRKKQQQQREHQHQQQHQQAARNQEEDLLRHIPKALLIPKSPDRTPPPLH